jgi:hypothetical protein
VKISDRSGGTGGPVALAAFVPPQRRPRRSTRTPLVLDIHPAFPMPQPKPSEARTLVRPAKKRRPYALILAVVAVLILVTALVAFRAPLVAAVPQLGALYSAVGLPVPLDGVEIRNVTAVRIYAGGWEKLRVEGTIVNATGRPQAVPTLEFAIVAADGTVIVGWQETVATGELANDAVLPFTTDFPEPPEGAANITVRFADGTAQTIATTAPPPQIL